MKKRHHKVVSGVTYGNSNEQIYLTNDIIMKSLRAKIIKWKRGKSTSKNTRNDENSAKLFDAIYENNFELAKFLLEDGEVDVNIKDDCGNTALIAVCQQATVQNEEEAVKFVNYLWQRGSKFKKSNDSGKTAMNYAESNGLMKIIETLQYIQWKILHNRLQEVYII